MMPLILRYEGAGAFQATGRMAELCDRALTVGQIYRVEEREERSSKSHAHWFACVHACWENLPDHLAERFPTAEHLRKYVLIAVGHCYSDTFVASSKAEAIRLAAFLRSGEEFTLVTVNGATVTRYRARSQSMRAQGKNEFLEVKEKALNKLAELIGTDPAELSRAEAA